VDTPLPRRLGGELCLDFVNTVDPRPGGRDYLVDAEALRAWAHDEGLPSRGGTLAPVLEIREALYRVFSATAAGRRPARGDLDAVGLAYAEALAHARLRADGSWSSDDVLLPVLQSAIDLLRSPRLARVKECPGVDQCGWLFLDTTKNASRRWCSMDGCGSRAKMRRYRARSRA
jgi:predicted RNA-binding Zn ribbon-like protein